ncbi:MAG: hypothetical protein WKF64_12140 [Ilumatobacteraceae bacterium]
MTPRLASSDLVARIVQTPGDGHRHRPPAVVFSVWLMVFKPFLDRG